MSDFQFQQYSALSGTDIHAMFGNFKFGSIQMLRYASNREKAPIFTLGSPSARATARGKRHINGAFVFTMIDRDGLVKAMAKAGGTGQQVFLSHDEIANFANAANQAIPRNMDPRAQQALLGGGTIGVTGVVGGGQYNPFVSESIFKPQNFGAAQTPYVADQLLPFDIVLIGIPEYGSVHSKRMIIHGVEITTEASGTSIDDLTIEKQHTFIARGISPWVPLADLNEMVGSGNQNVGAFSNAGANANNWFTLSGYNPAQNNVGGYTAGVGGSNAGAITGTGGNAFTNGSATGGRPSSTSGSASSISTAGPLIGGGTGLFRTNP